MPHSTTHPYEKKKQCSGLQGTGRARVGTETCTLARRAAQPARMPGPMDTLRPSRAGESAGSWDV